MARLSTCLNFHRDTGAAFACCRELFGGDRLGTRWMIHCDARA